MTYGPFIKSKQPTAQTRTAISAIHASPRRRFLSFVIRHSSFLFFLPLCLRAQFFLTNQPDPLLQLMMSQPPVDTQSRVVARASFDPPVVQVGGETIYRVSLNALSDSILQWPDEMVAPSQLEMKAGARGQILQVTGTNYQPLTVINYHVRAKAAGSFLVPQFIVEVYGRPVTIPGIRLVVVDDPQVEIQRPQRLELEIADTNVFLGQAVQVRLQASSPSANVIQALSQVQFNGDGLVVDATAARQRIAMTPRDGREIATYVYETAISPITSGPLTFSAQAFSSGNRFAAPVVVNGQVVIQSVVPQFTLLESDPVTLNVRPLPREGELPGFTGGIGRFAGVALHLETNMVKAGNPILLQVLMRGDDNLERLVPPPAPQSADWQVYAGEAVMTNLVATPTPTGYVFQPKALGWDEFPQRTGPMPVSILPGPAKLLTFTLVPLNEKSTATPSIPFSCFDPDRREYVDLTIPSLPVKVLPGTATTNDLEWLRMKAAQNRREEKASFHGLAKATGRSSESLRPLQARPPFLLVQLLPVAGFAGLWAWDRRRRYLEAHPELVRRRKARRALRRQKRELHAAAHAADAPRYARSAVAALQIACSPHYPAEPRALVCTDILPFLNDPRGSESHKQVVRRFFAATDSAAFGTQASDPNVLLTLRDELDAILTDLEAKLYGPSPLERTAA